MKYKVGDLFYAIAKFEDSLYVWLIIGTKVYNNIPCYIHKHIDTERVNYSPIGALDKNKSLILYTSSLREDL